MAKKNLREKEIKWHTRDSFPSPLTQTYSSSGIEKAEEEYFPET